MLKRMKLSAKLFGGFGLVLAMLIGVTGLYHFAVSSSSKGFENLMQTDVTISNHAAKADSLIKFI